MRPFLLLALVACCGDPPLVEPEVAVGTGEAAFVPLADGDAIDVWAGPQGGFHVLGSVRARGIEPGNPDQLGAPDNPTTQFRVLRGGARIDRDVATYQQGLDDAPDGWHQMVGRIVVLDISSNQQLAGVRFTLEVEVTPVDGAPLVDSVEVLGQPKP